MCSFKACGGQAVLKKGSTRAEHVPRTIYIIDSSVAMSQSCNQRIDDSSTLRMDQITLKVD